MNQRVLYKTIFLVLLITVMMVSWTDLAAQCPMCRMAAESNLANGGTEGKGLNKGILYMLAMPYILVSTVGFIWYKNNKSAKDEDESNEDENESNDQSQVLLGGQ